MTIYYRADSVMIERLLPDGKVQAGYYAMGYRFFEASNNVSYLFAALLLPMFSSMIKKKEAINSLVVMTSKIMFIGVAILSFICIFYASEIIELRYNSSEPQAIISFQLLMLCFIFISSTYIFGTLLTAGEHLNTLNKIALGGMIGNVILNFILIPKYGAIGGATASLITQGLTAIIQVKISLSNYKIRYSLKVIIQALSFFILLSLSGFLISKTDLFWLMQVFILLSFSIALVFLSRIISLGEVKTVVASKFK